MSKIIDSTKKFVKEHKPETLVTAITVGAVAVAGAYFMAHRNCINFTKELVDELSTGDYVRFENRGTEYVVALYKYLPESE